MKKSLIALAAVAASGAAFAQSSVTLFGTVDTSVAYVKSSVPGARSVTKHGLSNDGIGSSALGFRGTEDLGNGLKANFWLEAGVEPDVGQGEGNNFRFNRRSTLGLEGGFGEVRFGRELTAGHQKPSSYSVFGTIGAAGFVGWTGQDVRYNNMVTYVSPNFGGFSATANYAFDEQATGSTNRAGGYAGIQGTYANGPLSVTVSYDEANPSETTSAWKNTDARKVDVDTWTIGASYDFGVVKLSGLYHNADADSLNLASGVVTKSKLDSYAIGLTAPVGAAGKIKAQYAGYKGVGDAKANQFGLGYEHALSKRTAIYTTYAYMKNKNGMNLNTAQKLKNDALANAKVTSFQVGVRHSF